MSRDEVWAELKESYQENGLVLALGAGVSKGCKLPSWEQLLRRIAVRFYKKEGESIYQQLIRSGYTFPAIASILEAKCPPDTDFSEIIREEIYTA